nr:Unknown Function [uncultured bacterium]
MLRGRDFMMVLLDAHAHLGEHGQHLGAHVLRRIDRRNGEIATFHARPVAKVARFIRCVVVRRQFGRVQPETGVVRVRLVLDVVEDEEFGFRADHDRVADAFRLHVGLGLLGRAARVAVVGLARDRVENVAKNHHRRLREERIHVDRIGVGHQDHVGLVDGLPAGDRGAIEHHAVGEHVLVDLNDVHRHVLQLALGVGEAQVDELHVVVLDLLHDVFGCGHVLFP